MADDDTDTSNKEQSGFVLRYTIRNNALKQLYEYVDYKNSTGESVCHKIVSVLESAQLSVSDCRSQTNDGAWNMAGRSCVTHFQQPAPEASYFDCAFHDHKFALPVACNISDIQRMWYTTHVKHALYITNIASYWQRKVVIMKSTAKTRCLKNCEYFI